MSKIKKISILGGTGFLGQALAARLIKQGYQVSIPTRQRESFRELLVLPGLQLVQTDTHNQAALIQALQGSDAVINLVGILNETRSTTQKFKTAHVDFTQQLLDACEELNIQRFLQMSALKAEPETSPSEYLRTKGQAEALVQKSSLNTTVFRPSVIFGAKDSFVNKFSALLKMPSPFFFLPVPNARFAPVYVDDVVEGIVLSIDNPETYKKRYSCCGPKIYSMRELIQLIADTMGVKRKIIGLNPFLSKLVASFLGVMPGKPFTKDNYQSLQINNICENNGLEKLGVKPVSIESIIPQYLQKRDANLSFDEFRRTAGR